MSGSWTKGLDRNRNSPLVVFAIVLAVILLAAAGSDGGETPVPGSPASISKSAADTPQTAKN
jgi:hypothetical protein